VGSPYVCNLGCAEGVSCCVGGWEPFPSSRCGSCFGFVVSVGTSVMPAGHSGHILIGNTVDIQETPCAERLVVLSRNRSLHRLLGIKRAVELK
jgi:hypothetical protein